MKAGNAVQRASPALSLLAKGLAGAMFGWLAIPTANATDYPTAVLSDLPLAYYRLGDVPPQDTAFNLGCLGAAGNGIYSPGVTHRVPGALVSGDAAAGYNAAGGTNHTYVPYQSALNPPASKPFSMEFWAIPSMAVDDAAGPCPVANAVFSGNRSGWAFFQRSPSMGWNFRMYNGNGTNTAINLLGGVNATGAPSYIVAVWSGSNASLYVNGALAAPTTVPSSGYNPSTSAIFSVGSYGDGLQNLFTGTVDEVAFYTNILTVSQILNHYNNGLTSFPGVAYSTVVVSNGAVEYLRLDEPDPGVNIAANSGVLGPAGDGLHFPGLIHQVPGALAGNSDTAAGYWAIDTNSCDGGFPTIIPFLDALNPSGSFAVEFWAKPTASGLANAQCPIVNRYTDDQNHGLGWGFWQRADATQPIGGINQPIVRGWNFQMFGGFPGVIVFDLTGGSYTVGDWNHIVAVYDAAAGSATLYQNGEQIAQSSTPNGSYFANYPAPLAIGGLADGIHNPFIGSIDEVALYNAALSAGQVLAHYRNGTNAARSMPYETLVASDGAAEYLRLDEPARNVASNSGTLGGAANAAYVNTTNTLPGPQPPLFAGLESTNLAASFDGSTTYVELGNPAALNFAGQITLEAWIQPAVTQSAEACIIAHGPNDDDSAAVVLGIGNGQYQVLSHDIAGNYGAGFTIPDCDLGSGNWIHLAGTYDGGAWNLYRNGLKVATAANATGALVVTNANWAIGARGRWKSALGWPAMGEDQVFSGGLDEAAIYNVALSPARIRAHYLAGKYGTTTPSHPTLTIRSSGSNVLLTWPTGTLQQADDVTGAFVDLPCATSPWTLLPADARKFYRVRL